MQFHTQQITKLTLEVLYNLKHRCRYKRNASLVSNPVTAENFVQFQSLYVRPPWTSNNRGISLVMFDLGIGFLHSHDSYSVFFL